MNQQSSKDAVLEETANRIYAETEVFYNKMASAMGPAALGFKILYGPPKVRAPVLYLGSQPGGGAHDALIGERQGERKTWPQRFEYCVSSYDLAQRARETWTSKLLDESTGMNANFFRSPGDKEWKLVPKEVRQQIEAFCLPRAQELVLAHKPQKLIVIGISQFNQLSDKAIPVRTLECSQTSRGRIVVEGMIWGIPAQGVKHLTARWTTPDDRSKIRFFYRSISN